MQQLRKQRECYENGFMVADIIIDGVIVGWTVADRQMQRLTDKNFVTASMAFEWGEVNVKGLF